jgi:EAL domain-containing protein (putative c-di-GMP-specific phosphodiesterase class I)
MARLRHTAGGGDLDERDVVTADGTIVTQRTRLAVVPDPALPGTAAALFERPARVDTHDCSCHDLLATIDRHEPRPSERTASLRAALAHPDAVRCHYQPIVDLGTGSVVAFEALLRVHGPDGPVPPAVLFGAAAEGGWSQALDQVARRTAILGAGPWLGRERKLFVNFVPSSIYDPAVCLRTTEAAATEAGVAMEQLVFEVVETERIRDIDHLRTIFRRYHEMGAGVALDDLGAGHASLAVAEALSPDVMKLDGAVVRALPHDADARRFAAAAVALAATSGAIVLAEGVEAGDQAEVAIELGVQLGQGWHFGRPAPGGA